MKRLLTFIIALVAVLSSCITCFAASSDEIERIDEPEYITNMTGINEIHFYYSRTKVNVTLILNNDNYNNILFDIIDFYCIDTVTCLCSADYPGGEFFETISFKTYEEFLSIISEGTGIKTSSFGSYSQERVFEVEQVTVTFDQREYDLLNSIKNTLENFYNWFVDNKDSLHTDGAVSVIEQDEFNTNYLLILILFGEGVLIGCWIVKHFSFWKW